MFRWREWRAAGAATGADSGGSGSVPQRTYITGMTVGLGGILMFFMALVSAYIVRNDIPNSGWHPLAVPRILWLNTAVLIASSFTLVRARKRFVRTTRTGSVTGGASPRFWACSFSWGKSSRGSSCAPRAFFWPRIRAAAFSTSSPPRTDCTCWAACWRCAWILFRPTHRLTQGTATEVAAMYWHFMDGLWVFLFLLFLLGR